MFATLKIVLIAQLLFGSIGLLLGQSAFAQTCGGTGDRIVNKVIYDQVPATT